MKNLLDKQKVFFRTRQTFSYEFRKSALSKLYHVIKREESELNAALKKDLGKPVFESYGTEIGYILKEISHVQKKLKKWMKPKFSWASIVNFPGWSRVYAEPYGQTLVIAPWNYPFQLALSPLIGAIAAGNTCIVKTSEISVETSKIIKKIIMEVFDEEYVAVVEGGKEATQELLAIPFDYIFFTGSTTVGRIVMQAAANYLTPVTLELGGKSPCIIDKSADLKVSAKRIAWGKFLNAGQTCVAPDYLYIHKDIKEKFIKALILEIKGFFGEDIQSSSDYGRIINENHFNRLVGLIDEKKVCWGNKQDLSQRFLSPTLLDNISWEDKVMDDEIFGPILPMLEYENIENVIDKINEGPKPLALYLFSEDHKIQREVITKCSFGGGCINDTIVHLAEDKIPFGGVGASGLGAYHGKYSFETFSHSKSILIKPTWIDIPIRYAPYKMKIKILKMLMK